MCSCCQNFGLYDAKGNFGILSSASPMFFRCMNWSSNAVMEFGCLWNENFVAEREVLLIWNELLWGAMWNFGFLDAKGNFGIHCSASPPLFRCMN
ncbi:hypothetical protein U1Q18_022576, partial [Sarracenia purpurea var. burkii]